ncbi:MAG: UvrD-helicase domain-containing protein [Spirochaetes bacterium]|nr:UvrD-helicase domain-containing protein [Spirochaetota bacterium]
MKLNDEQQAAAFCCGNAVVAAGAGSGKTMVLANRFAWLITEKKLKVSEILTLTFTKKAAAQMYRRIHSLLSEIASVNKGGSGAAAAGARQALAKQALDDFIHARIQTLDSYSTAIVKQGASRYGLSPHFNIDQERCEELAKEVSLPFLIEKRRHPAIERLYYGKKSVPAIHEFFTKILFEHSCIYKEHDLTLDVKKQLDTACGEWKCQCEYLVRTLSEIESAISADAELLPDLASLLGEYKNSKNNVPACPTAVEIRRYFDFLLEINDDDCIERAESHPLQKAIASFLEFLSAIRKLDLNYGKRDDNPVKEKIKQLRDVFGSFSSLAVFCMQAGFTISIMSLIQKLSLLYLEKKRAEKVLTFSDVAQLARTILLEHADIRQAEKESFKAIMIDEFQDNNELQKETLFLLAEKLHIMTAGIPCAADLCDGKLFFVGDEKQSIYLFRGADVSVFKKLKTELNSDSLPLKTNYRSAPGLIAAFNAIFGGGGYDPYGKQQRKNPAVFALGERLPLYEAAYTPLEAAPAAEADTPDAAGSAALSLCIFDKKTDTDMDSAAAYENEARFVAMRILQLLEEKTESGQPKYQPGDIALLFRAKSSQVFFEKHLRLLGIPYASEDLGDFFYGGLVNDIMSVLRLCAYPQDISAYAQMLRSPFAGLSLSGLADCLSVFKNAQAANSPGANPPSPFDDAPLSMLAQDDREKYKNGQKIYNLIKTKAAAENISSLVSELWYNLGYRYETEWNRQVAVYRQLFDYLFHLALAADTKGQGLAAFTDFIADLRISGKRLDDMEIPLERAGAVHLLTVHKSKGLEYPVVFLCSCGRRGHNNVAADVSFSKDAGLVFNLPTPISCSSIPDIKGNFFWENIKEEEKRKKTAELRRLLYVGMTRAEKKLYLTGCLDIGAGKDDGNDFSQCVKKYVDTKKARVAKQKAGGENDVYDHIIDDDTFFGLCLPAVAAYIGLDAFFNIEAIPSYMDGHTYGDSSEYEKKRQERDSLSDFAGGIFNDQNALSVFFKNSRPFYENAQVLETPVLRETHFTPTSPHHAQHDEFADASNEGLSNDSKFSGEASFDIFEKIDSLLARFNAQDGGRKTKFNSGSFGTIAHICVQAILDKEEPQIPHGISGYLSPGETEVFLEAGKALAARFVRCPLGIAARDAHLRESEFPFRSIVNPPDGEEYFISGTIDLLFEYEDSIHVVDFKTDSYENPSEHFVQMASYYRAAKDLFARPLGKNCRAWLYYLRSGHAVEVTEKVKNAKR